MFRALGRLLVRRARLVLALSLVVLVGAIALSGGAFSKLQGGGFASPGAESTRAQDLVDQKFGGDPNLLLLVEAKSGTVDDPAATAAAARLSDTLKARPQLRNVTS